MDKYDFLIVAYNSHKQYGNVERSLLTHFFWFKYLKNYLPYCGFFNIKINKLILVTFE